MPRRLGEVRCSGGDFSCASGVGVVNGSIRKGCESYKECTIRCAGEVWKIEVITSGAKKYIQSVAELAAREVLKQYIVVAGTISTILSVLQTADCFYYCRDDL